MELLKRGRVEDGGKPGNKAIDEFLNPGLCPTRLPADSKAFSPIPKDVAVGLKRLLSGDYDDYAFAPDSEKRSQLMRLLEEHLDERRREGGEKYADREPPPRDLQRQRASVREKTIAAQGGVAVKRADSDSLAFDDEIPF